MRELDPSYRADTLPPKRLRRVKLFGNGELNRLIADALRRAEKPLASSDIAEAIVTVKGFGRPSIHALMQRCLFFFDGPAKNTLELLQGLARSSPDFVINDLLGVSK